MVHVNDSSVLVYAPVMTAYTNTFKTEGMRVSVPAGAESRRKAAFA